MLLYKGLKGLSWLKSPYFCRELQKESNTQSSASGQSWCFRMWSVWEDKSYSGRVALYFYSVYIHLKGCCCFCCVFVWFFSTSLCINLLKTNSRSALWISVNTSLFQYVQWLKPTFCGTSYVFPTKWHLRNEIWAGQCSWLVRNLLHPIRSTTQWHVINMEFLHLFLRHHFVGKPTSGVAKCRLSSNLRLSYWETFVNVTSYQQRKTSGFFTGFWDWKPAFRQYLQLL